MQPKAWVIWALAGLCCAAGPESAAAQAASLIYRCVRDGRIAFADRPCAVDALQMHLPPANLSVYEPVPPPDSPGEWRESGAVSRATTTARGQSRNDGAARKTAQRIKCQQLQAGIDRVNSLMRAGYSGPRGEALRARWHALKDQYYRQRCLGLR